MTKENGGPAFPSNSNHDYSLQQNIPTGMSLRDYFAAAAMQGILSRENNSIADMTNTEPTAMTASYMIADAMLAARGQS